MVPWGESYTVGRAESESEVEIVGKPGKILKNLNFKISKIRIFSFLFILGATERRAVKRPKALWHPTEFRDSRAQSS